MADIVDATSKLIDEEQQGAIVDNDDDNTTINNNNNTNTYQSSEQQQQESNDDYNSSHVEDNDNDLNDEYFETLDIDKLNLNNKNNFKNGDQERMQETPQDLESNVQNETKLTNIDYNRYTTSIIDTSCTNYDQNIDLKDLLSNRDDNFHDSEHNNNNIDDSTSNNNNNNNYKSESDDPIINRFVKEAIVFGANALDLSKKNLVYVPKLLFKLENLQVSY